MLLILLCLLFTSAFAAKSNGKVNLNKDDGFSFLSKFCFGYKKSMNESAGTLKITLEDHNKNVSSNYIIAMYDDQESSFRKIHGTDLNCSEKIKNYPRYLQHFTFENGRYEATIEIHEHLRPRWWWTFVVNCDIPSSQSVSVTYHTHYTQNYVSNWYKEAGMNERGLNTMYLVYLFIYIILFSFQLYIYQIYRIQQYIHQVIKILTAAVALQLFGVLFHFVDWMIFTENGKHEFFFEIFSGLLDIGAMTAFLLLLLLLAQGWTISYIYISWPKITGITTIIVALFQSSFYIWRLIGLNSETTVYFYNSVPEWCFASLLTLLGIIFLILCLSSWINEKMTSKRKLYFALGIFFSLWFFEPLIQIPIGDVFDPWVRDIAMDTMSLTWTTISFMVMMFLLRPSFAHQYFNFSTIDTQESMLNDAAKSNYNVL